MTTDFFIKQLKTQKDEDRYLAERIVRKYVPYEDKVATCSSIVNACSHVTVDGTVVYQKNTPVKYLNFKLVMISKYTDIEIDFNNVVDEYNKLDELELIDEVISFIPKHERLTFEKILDATQCDLDENERSLASIINDTALALQKIAQLGA